MPSLRRTVRTGMATVAVGATMAVVASVAPPVVSRVAPLLAPASHTSGTLCTGYSGCKQEGRSSAGYAKRNDRMYWQMYSGHNCTNYVAYRMVRKGMANRRPWSGPGNATHWGTELKRRTNRTPRVGSVAWWKAGSSRGGGSGHVAYVEKVLSPNTIVVSQDSWGGDFSWATITRSTGWPHGFIHLKDTPLRNRERPDVFGPRRVGELLTATRGRWTPRAKVRYRWTAGGKRVTGADTRSIRLSRHMLGERIRVETVATKLGYPRATARSTPTRAVLPGLFDRKRRPDLTGRAQVNGRLRVSPGAWSPRPKRISYRWYAGGDRIKGADSRTLRLGPGTARERVTVEVSVGRPGYKARTATLRTKRAIRPDRLRLTRGPRLAGSRRLGRTLGVRLGHTAPRAARTVRWLRDGEAVQGADGRRYRLTRADLGHRISARVIYRKQGYYALTRWTDRTSLVKATPRVRTSADRTKRGVRLQVLARVAGRPLATKVAVVRGGRVLARSAMRSGKATLRLRGLPPGRSRIRVLVAGTRSSEPVELVRRVRR